MHVPPLRDRMSQATETEVLGLEETSMNVAAILKMKGKGVFTASADTSLLEIAKLLEQHGIEDRFVGEGLRVPDVPGLSDRLTVFDAGSVRISSSGLRASLRRGESAESSVPGPVAEYITKHCLYRSPAAAR